ncbi:MAG: hypothetical protein E8D42_07790 [Nitrospira sp.]|nr:MAG: hypothetical protein E8D42_07790 [Nitrospira sp.]
MTVEALRPLHIRRAAGDLHLRPGHPVELPDDDAVRLLAKTDKIYPVLHPGDSVEWMSPALPKQQGEVLVVHQDRTFEVFHPLTVAVCRLPVAWVLRVVRGPMNTAGRPNE